MSVAFQPLRIPLKDDGPKVRKLIKVDDCGLLVMKERPSIESVVAARYEEWIEARERS